MVQVYESRGRRARSERRRPCGIFPCTSPEDCDMAPRRHFSILPNGTSGDAPGDPFIVFTQYGCFALQIRASLCVA